MKTVMLTKIRRECKTTKASAALQGYNQSRNTEGFPPISTLQGNNCVRPASHSTGASNIIELIRDASKHKMD